MGELAAWLVTFALHSTAVLGLLWLARPLLARTSDPVHEVLVKFALVASLCSATLQVALGSEPAAGHLATVTPATGSAVSMPPSPPDLRMLLLVDLEAGLTALPATPPVTSWSEVLVGVAALAALLGLALGLRLRLGLWRILRRRRPVNSGPIAEELRRLQRLAGLRRRVRLSVCETLQTPIAFGFLWPEICLPQRAQRDLDPDECTAMLAHELAHVARWDPLWLSGTELLARLFPWQPLFRSARRRLRDLAEYRCDAWASRLAGELPLAGCLLKVAGWVTGAQAPVRLVPCMAQRGSNLRRRIDRLLEGPSAAATRLQRLWLAPACGALLFAMTSVLPGATWSRSTGSPEPSAGPREPSPLVAFEMERAALGAELEALRSELPPHPHPDPELISLLEELDQRLASFERHRTRLLALLSVLGEETTTPIERKPK